MTLTQALTATALFVPAALLCLALLGRFGWFTPHHLAGPVRDIGLGRLDLLIALSVPVVMLGANVAASTIADPRGLVVAQVLLLAALGWFLVRCRNQRGFERIGLLPSPTADLGREAKLAAVGTLVALVVVLGCNALVITLGLLLGQSAPAMGHDMLRQMQQTRGAELAALVIAAVVIAPVLEELLFRGLLQTALAAHLGWDRRRPAILCAAAAWAAIHGSVPWQVMPGLFTLGLILGALYERTGSLRVVLAVHAAFNAANVSLVLSGLV